VFKGRRIVTVDVVVAEPKRRAKVAILAYFLLKVVIEKSAPIGPATAGAIDSSESAPYKFLPRR